MALYDSPQAKIKYYGFESSLFSIRRGTWQACPLSPLLFILALKPLAEAIRYHPDIRGVDVAGSTNNVSLVGSRRYVCPIFRNGYTFPGITVRSPPYVSPNTNFKIFWGDLFIPALTNIYACRINGGFSFPNLQAY